MICLFAGGPPNCCALKLSEAGLRISVGSPVTVKVTGIVKGVFEAFGPLTVMEPLYVPAVRLPRAADTVRVPGVFPEAGETLSQLPPEVVEAAAVKFTTAPVLDSDTIWAAGELPPCVAEKVSEGGVPVRTGEAGPVATAVPEINRVVGFPPRTGV